MPRAAWVTAPRADETVTPPFPVQGAIPGTWYFEGVLPLEIRDRDGNLLHEQTVRAQGDWMTTGLVPFSSAVDFELDEPTPALLILRRSNPSGLPARDEQASVPIMLMPNSTHREALGADEREQVEAYVRSHLDELSPVEPVLGGSFYATSVSWLDNGVVRVEYEDGHEHHALELRADVSDQRVTIEDLTLDEEVPIQRALDGKIVYTTERLFGRRLDALYRDCERRRGTFDRCGSPCVGGELCVEVCAYTCDLPSSGP